ncbi:hypothetical protein G6321_00019200 [Bradyrhizobium barranii subsp. barranii]|uniref:Uncharacterized protein n=1 Tax=Bradyrhizobium barranii subsp. barranii TaxID=2823807 RepID=A0A7Z0QM72_9BRAD|nr:hypothetical protein [Bradyrhizobium barranii]UGX97138.1 hypothetical protein G6321_00019200 [Bradyrhizobium barranii subsp. barranii]
MTLSDMLQYVSTNLAIPGVTGATAAGLVIWLSKAWISEKIKGQIKHEYDIEIERIKSVLNIAAAERQLLFSRLYEKRADVIAQVYAALKAAISATSTYTRSLTMDKGQREGDRRTASEAVAALTKLHDCKRLFLPQSTAAALDTIIRELQKSFVLYSTGPDLGLGNTKDQAAQWQGVIERLDRLSNQTVEELEHEFRVLLGEKAVS